MDICESETFAEDIDMSVLPDLISVVAKSSQSHFENALLECVEGDKSGGIGELPQLIMGPVKRADRIRTKVEEYKLENSQGKVPYTQFIRDVLRATIVCYSAGDIVRAYENIRDFDAFEIVRLKNKMGKHKPPYNLHVNFLYKSQACAVPILCEVQIFSKNVHDMQHRQHIAYELARTKTINELV